MSDPAQTNIYLNIKKDWYIYEENYGQRKKQFIVFINSVIDNLKENMQEFIY